MSASVAVPSAEATLKVTSAAAVGGERDGEDRAGRAAVALVTFASLMETVGEAGAAGHGVRAEAVERVRGVAVPLGGRVEGVGLVRLARADGALSAQRVVVVDVRPVPHSVPGIGSEDADGVDDGRPWRAE